jgi:hypothetical protein
MAVWGRQTRVKLLGGSLVFREVGHTWDDYVEQMNFIKRRALDLTDPFTAFEQVYIDQTVQVFASEGLPEPWPALSPAYSQWKEKAYPGMPMMRRTDRLFESVTGQSDEGFWEVGPRSIRFGTRVPYWTHTEQVRPIGVFLPETRDALMELVRQHLQPPETGPE